MSALPAMPSSSVARATDLSSNRCSLPTDCPSPTAQARAAIIADPYMPNLHWVPIDLAATALSVTPQALRLKAPELLKGGLAKRINPVVGGQLKWHFSSHYDTRLATLVSSANGGVGPFGHEDSNAIADDAFARFRAAPKHRQNAAVAKAIAVKEYREWRRSPTTRLSDPAHQASLRTRIAALGGNAPKHMQRLTEWNELVGTLNLNDGPQYQAACWELLDRRGGNREASYSGEAWDLFKAEYLRDNKLSVRHCWEVAAAAARKNGWTWISPSRAKQLVHELLPASVRTLAREGEESWQRAHLPSINQDPNAWQAGQCWETDHTRCDFFVQTVRGGNVVAERPWITAFLDRRSRRLMGWSMGFEANSDSIRAALHDALSREDASVPEHVVLDNGKDFASQEFSGLTKSGRRRGDDPSWPGLFATLGIALNFAAAYNHNGKARIERFFGVVHQGFDRTLDSWSGSGGNSGGRDQDAVDAAIADPIKLPTLDQVRVKFAAWTEHYNHNAERNIEALVTDEGHRLSPAEFYAKFLPSFRALPNKRRVLTMLEHRWSKPITPTKNGVAIKLSGRTLSYGQHEPAVVDLVGSGTKVHVTYNPSDLNSVRVYDERFALLCEAPMNTRHGGPTDTPLARKDLQTAVARQRQHKRDVRRQVDIAAAVLPIADLARIEEREREVASTKARMKAEGIDNPPPMRLVSSALSGTSPSGDEASSIPLRKAAGAEHDEFPFDIQRLLNATSPAAEEDDTNDDSGSFSLLEAMSAKDPGGVSEEDDGIGFDILRDLGA